MLSKRLEVNGIVSWSNLKRNNCLFAVGHQIDQEAEKQGSQTAKLELYVFDITDQSKKSSLLADTQTESSFCSLAWENFGINGEFTHGIIAGGMRDGSVSLWDVNSIINMYKQREQLDQSYNEVNDGCIALQDVAEGPINAVSFNPQKPNLLASGGDQVLIHNLDANVSDPEVVFPGDDSPHEDSRITSVAWNQKILHILASASVNSTIVVWDLKTNQPIFDFSNAMDSEEDAKQVIISWNPEIATQLAVTSDNSTFPELQIWDLRNPNGPVQTFEKGHDDGIHYVNWCKNDPSLLLSGGRDGKIVCWNYQTCEKVSQVQSQSIKQVVWSTKLPGIFSVATEENEINIYKIGEDTILTNYAPKGIQPVVGASFGFGNCLSVFSEKEGSSITEYSLQTYNEEEEKHITNFQELYSENTDGLSWCDQRSKNPELSKQQQEEWKFMKMLFQNEDERLVELGFNKKEILKKVEKYTGKVSMKKEEQPQKKQKRTSVSKQVYSKMSLSDANGFFEQLRIGKRKNTKKAEQKEEQKTVEKSGFEKYQQENISRNKNWNTGVEEIIKNNILIGNFEGAINSAMKCGRQVEALLLAYSQSQELFDQTVKSYFLKTQDYFVKKIIRNIVEKNYEDITDCYYLDKWQEVTALIISNVNSDEQKPFFDKLAKRFTEENQLDKAFIMNILANNFDGMIEYLAHYLNQFPINNTQRKTALISVTEKLLVISQVNQVNENPKFSDIILEFSELLIKNQKFDLSLTLLEKTSPSDWRTQSLRERIFFSRMRNVGEDFQENHPSPLFPFKVAKIGVSKQQKQQEQQGSREQQEQLEQQEQEETQRLTPKKSHQKQHKKSRFDRQTPIQKFNQPIGQSPNNPVQKQVKSELPRQKLQKARRSQLKQKGPPRYNMSRPFKTSQTPQKTQTQLPGQLPPKQQNEKSPQQNIKKQFNPPPKQRSRQQRNKPPHQQMRRQHQPPPSRQMKAPPSPIQKAPPKRKKPVMPPPQDRQQKIQEQFEEQLKKKDSSRNVSKVVEFITYMTQYLPQIEKNINKRQTKFNTLSTLIENIENNNISNQTLVHLNTIADAFQDQNVKNMIKAHQKICKSDWKNSKDWLKILKKIFQGL